ncbi:glucokinase [Ascidiaceihabitans sp.]|uniref:glucokinase n=1 Tax=Ascidiaceihabitans sp. TaxID=1872644 RepID=UPI003296D04E
MENAPTLLADVGGTNTRLAVYWQGQIVAGSTMHYANARMDSFESVVAMYLAHRGGTRPNSLCVAIAGPVTGRSGALTNGAWRFDADVLQGQLGFDDVQVINDLAALGYALPALPTEAVQRIGGGAAQDGQALVVGVATGFNVSLSADGRVFQAELGHASLPVRVMQILKTELGAAAQEFQTVEQCFSGLGLAKIHTLLCGVQAEPAAITRGCDPASQATKALFARALGVFCREMIYQYLPLGGLYFNGSLARAILGQDVAEIVVQEAGQDAAFAGRFGEIPLYLITDDTAALYGCARYISG